MWHMLCADEQATTKIGNADNGAFPIASEGIVVDEEHPLFMMTCPKQGEFETNAALGALAQLIDDADDDDTDANKKHETTAVGDFSYDEPAAKRIDTALEVSRHKRNGGKVRADRSSRPNPYGSKSTIRTNRARSRRPTSRTAPTLGQAQICLSLTGF